MRVAGVIMPGQLAGSGSVGQALSAVDSWSIAFPCWMRESIRMMPLLMPFESGESLFWKFSLGLCWLQHGHRLPLGYRVRAYSQCEGGREARWCVGECG